MDNIPWSQRIRNNKKKSENGVAHLNNTISVSEETIETRTPKRTKTGTAVQVEKRRKTRKESESSVEEYKPEVGELKCSEYYYQFLEEKIKRFYESLIVISQNRQDRN